MKKNEDGVSDHHVQPGDIVNYDDEHWIVRCINFAKDGSIYSMNLDRQGVTTCVDPRDIDRSRLCSKCGRTVLIPHNQIGGFWHLSGFIDKAGIRHYGGYCCECFDQIRDR